MHDYVRTLEWTSSTSSTTEHPRLKGSSATNSEQRVGDAASASRHRADGVRSLTGQRPLTVGLRRARLLRAVALTTVVGSGLRTWCSVGGGARARRQRTEHHRPPGGRPERVACSPRPAHGGRRRSTRRGVRVPRLRSPCPSQLAGNMAGCSTDRGGLRGDLHRLGCPWAWWCSPPCLGLDSASCTTGRARCTRPSPFTQVQTRCPRPRTWAGLGRSLSRWSSRSSAHWQSLGSSRYDWIVTRAVRPTPPVGRPRVETRAVQGSGIRPPAERDATSRVALAQTTGQWKSCPLLGFMPPTPTGRSRAQLSVHRAPLGAALGRFSPGYRDRP